MSVRKEVMHMNTDPPVIFDPEIYRGVDIEDEEAIANALLNDEQLTINYYGHVCDSSGHWIADAMHHENTNDK